MTSSQCGLQVCLLLEEPQRRTGNSSEEWGIEGGKLLKPAPRAQLGWGTTPCVLKEKALCVTCLKLERVWIHKP